MPAVGQSAPPVLAAGARPIAQFKPVPIWQRCSHRTSARPGGTKRYTIRPLKKDLGDVLRREEQFYIFDITKVITRVITKVLLKKNDIVRNLGIDIECTGRRERKHKMKTGVGGTRKRKKETGKERWGQNGAKYLILGTYLHGP